MNLMVVHFDVLLLISWTLTNHGILLYTTMLEEEQESRERI